MEKTKIDWCDSTWNPVTGCQNNCEYCYAKNIVNRFGKHLPDLSDFACKHKGLHSLEHKIDKTPYPFGFEPTFYVDKLDEYFNKKGRNIFVCSMADLFGKWIPDNWIEDIFSACKNAPQHNYLFLTKNPSRYVELYEKKKLPQNENMWYGSTVTTPETSAFFGGDGYNTFWSIEPLLSPFGKMQYNQTKKLPNWVIVGAETGRRKDKVIPEKEWVEEIVEECKAENIPVFMKSNLMDIWGEPLIQEFPAQLQLPK